MSDNKAIQSGVPQGSILGPLLFNIYIHDVINIDNDTQFVMYANDTSLFFNSSDIKRLINHANNVLDKLHEWTLLNSLAINKSKTKAVLFRPKNQKENIENPLMIGTSTVDIVPSVKSLGVVFEEHLFWSKHIEIIANKLSRVVGILTRLRFSLPTNIKLLIYNSLFLSHLNCCHLVWGNTTTSNLTKLVLLQKKAVRAISGSPYDAHTEPLFKSLNVRPVQFLYNDILLMRYYAGKKRNNNNIEQLPRLTRNTNIYNTRHNETWIIPHARTNYGNQSLCYTLPFLLNSLDN